MSASSRQTLLPLAVGLSLLVGWHGLSLMLPPFLMAGPLEVLQAMVHHASDLATAAATTGTAALAGLGIAAITGLAARPESPLAAPVRAAPDTAPGRPERVCVCVCV